MTNVISKVITSVKRKITLALHLTSLFIVDLSLEPLKTKKHRQNIFLEKGTFRCTMWQIQPTIISIFGPKKAISNLVDTLFLFPFLLQFDH